MKISKPVAAFLAFFLPFMLTIAWFYSGIPKVNKSPVPDFASIDLAQPPLSTLEALPESPKSATINVLIDMKHGNNISLSEIDPLLRNIESLGGAIEVYKEDGDLSTRLKTASSFLCPVPMNSFTPEEMKAIISFVERGGRLVVVTDPTRNTLFSDSGNIGLSGVDAANLILEPFDLSFKDDYLYNMVENEGNFRNIILTDFSKNPLMKDIDVLVIYGGHSLNASGMSLVTVNKGTISSLDEQSGDLSPMKITDFHKGQVVAIGDISLMTGQYVQSADNQVFVRNLARFLTESNRDRTLAEFPYLFQADVVIQPTGKLKVDGELISAISNLENAMNVKAGSLTISQEPDTKTDRILLTTFESSKETKDILETLKIDLSPELPVNEENEESGNSTAETKVTQTATPTITPSPTPTPTATQEETGESDLPYFSDVIPSENPEEISVPGMGIVKTDGLGVVGLVQENNRSTLVIMATSPEKIQELINQLSNENLKNCLIHENLATCRISAGSSEPVG
jgi:hypothetical protein